MSERYALFMFEPGEAGGGVNDLALIGSLDECIAHAEASKDQRYYVAEIASHETLRLVMSGAWRRTPSPIVGGQDAWAYEWLRE